MSAASPVIGPRWIGPRPGASIWLLFMCLAALLCSTGCVSTGGTRSPGRTTVQPKAATLQARILSNFFLVEAKQADGHTYRFLIDTGSRATLVSSALAKSLRLKEKSAAPSMVRLSGAMADELELESATLNPCSWVRPLSSRYPSSSTTSPNFLANSAYRSTASSASQSFATPC